MKKLVLSIALTCLGQQLFAQTIEQVRNLGIGQTVTVSGVVTNGSELGPIRYMQDGTAGIACYGSNLNTIIKGDSITAVGVLFEFNGLLELSPTNSFTNHGQAVVQPAAQVIPIPSAGEALEGQLVRFDNVTLFKRVALPQETARFKFSMVPIRLMCASTELQILTDLRFHLVQLALLDSWDSSIPITSLSLEARKIFLLT